MSYGFLGVRMMALSSSIVAGRLISLPASELWVLANGWPLYMLTRGKRALSVLALGNLP
jgi:hypothetical protein